MTACTDSTAVEILHRLTIVGIDADANEGVDKHLLFLDREGLVKCALQPF